MEKENQKITIAIGLSGGVDSSVAAYLLKNQGYRVIGLFMKNWEDDEYCPAAQDMQDVIHVCNTLDIPFYSINFAKQYYDLVFQNLLDGLKAGLTPNPDILCNKYIKFDALLAKAQSLGADYLATGHYADIQPFNNHPILTIPKDLGKDQTYFLYTLNSSILKHVLFPLSQLTKDEVRKIAKDQNLITHNKKDSTGICFIGKRNFKTFIEHYIPKEKGKILSINGKYLGEHDGAFYYTIGQRKGLGVGGSGPPWFVVGKDMQKNEVILAQGEDHKALFSKSLTAIAPTWMSEEIASFSSPLHCFSKIRYRQQLQPCIVEKGEDGTLHVHFPQAQRAITPSQSIVFYQNNHCIGGAIIQQAGPSLYETNENF